MKKLTLGILSTFLMLSVIPTQLKANTESNPAATNNASAIKTTETNVGSDKLSEIKAIDVSALSSSENKEALKEASPLTNDQDGRHKKYRNRHPNKSVDVTIRADHRVHGDGYYEGRHRHGSYVGGGGVILLIIILILIL